MQTKLGKDFFFAKTPYHDRTFVAKALNGTWSKKENMFKFPKNLHSMRELMLKYPELQKDGEFVETGRNIKTVQDKFLKLKSLEDCEGDERLRNYQRVDVNYLKHLPSAAILNSPRTGKTPTSIILMKEKCFNSILIVCPASLIWNWKKEFEKWYTECAVYVATGTKKQRQTIYTRFEGQVYGTPTVLIISKDTWKSEPLDYKFDAVFIDEAHFLRNRKSKQTEAILKIKADHRYCLTGTPTVKHGSDIFGILHFLYPKKFTSFWQFVERYFVVTEDYMGRRELGEVKAGRKDEFKELIGFISVQRKREDVMKWLPDKQRITIYSQMDKKQLKMYNDMAEDMLAIDEDVEVDTALVLTQLLRLRQLCLDPRLVGFKETGAKTKALLEWLDDNREPVVIMSMFTSYYDLIVPDIEKLGLKVGRLDGKMSNTQKDQSATDFQAGKIDVLLCNILSAGVGFTLDKAKVILFMDKAWNPSDNEQAEDRVVPTTEDKNHAHEIISFVIENTVDERINDILEHKKSMTDIVNNGGREAIKKLLGRS